MSADRAFLDTNVFVYLYSGTDALKQQKAMQAMNKVSRFVSTQVLNEFCNVALRKMKMPHTAVKKAVKEICSICNVAMVDDITINIALDVQEKYGYAYYDALIIASALECDCQYLLSEDMADGQIIDDRLTIKNIFA